MSGHAGEHHGDEATLRLGTGAADLARAADLLTAGLLVGLPTETVYGLAVRADDPDAVARLYAAKGRPADNPLIVHVASVAGLEAVTTHLTPLAVRLLEHFAPGPLTVVLEAHPDLPSIVTAGLGTVAVRIPDHPVALEVLRRCGLPLAAPSANRSGRPSPTCAAHVHDDLDGRIAAVVDGGATRLGLESTVVDARGPAPVILREGAVSREDLIGFDVRTLPDLHATPSGPTGPTAPTAPHAPGTRHPHYIPGLPLHVAAAGSGAATARALLAERGEGSGTAGRIGLVTCGDPGADLDGLGPAIELLATPSDADALAAELFALLRRAEGHGLAALVIEAVPEDGIGRAVMDRIRRAAQAPQFP